MTGGLILEQLTLLVMEELLLFVSTETLVAHWRPVPCIREVDSRFRHHLENIRDIALFSGGYPAVHHVEIEPAVIVVIEKFRAPAPAGFSRAGFARYIRECQISVVVPQKIAFAHV